MNANIWSVLLAGNLAALLLLLFSFPFLEPGSESQAVAYLSLGIILASLAGLAVVIHSGWEPFRDR